MGVNGQLFHTNLGYNSCSYNDAEFSGQKNECEVTKSFWEAKLAEEFQKNLKRLHDWMLKRQMKFSVACVKVCDREFQ